MTGNGFEIGTDTITFTGQPACSDWEPVDQGRDKRFTSSDGQSFTITGAAGVDPPTLVTGLMFNSAHVYDDKGFPIDSYPYYFEFAGHVGSETTAPLSFGLRSMFIDETPENLTVVVEPFFPFNAAGLSGVYRWYVDGR